MTLLHICPECGTDVDRISGYPYWVDRETKQRHHDPCPTDEDRAESDRIDWGSCPQVGDTGLVKCSDLQWRRATCVMDRGQMAWRFEDGALRLLSTSTSREWKPS